MCVARSEDGEEWRFDVSEMSEVMAGRINGNGNGSGPSGFRLASEGSMTATAVLARTGEYLSDFSYRRVCIMASWCWSERGNGDTGQAWMANGKVIDAIGDDPLVDRAAQLGTGMLWTGDCPSARVHGLAGLRARLGMGRATSFGAWQRNSSTGGTGQRRKRCAAEKTAAVSLNRSESDLWLARPKLGLLKADRGGWLFLPLLALFALLSRPNPRPSPLTRSLQPRISSTAQARQAHCRLSLSWLTGLDAAFGGARSTGPATGGGQPAEASPLHRS
ncbi:hypothetical protein AOQ84DRAFT_223491 [Glonium stellatum]|uniref:Uncharacterized protein n=1 Tax=Glonium stellatum TaxID=574774 RepID=A0A8E2JRH4_9PEZI|nr:hypothetical protein AOQ84DRAFT_223491 [Glonium stellatum]